MLSRLTKVISISAAGAAVIFLSATAPAAAKDWRSSMDRHYKAAAETRYDVDDETAEWGFTLNEVVADMAWRQRTAEILRGTPRPSTEANDSGRGQLADRPATTRLRFAF